MALAEDVRKTLTDPTPLYFAAGVIDKIRQEAPGRLAAARETDTRELQEKLARQAKETQAKVSETLTGLDADIKRLREQAQQYALQGVGLAAEYAVKAKEGYDELAVRGRGAVASWRGEDDGPEVKVERTTVKVAEPPQEDEPASGRNAAAETASTGGTAAPGPSSKGEES